MYSQLLKYIEIHPFLSIKLENALTTYVKATSLISTQNIFPACWNIYQQLIKDIQRSSLSVITG
jgi:hypothetical protein